MRAVYWGGIIVIAAVVSLFAASNRAMVTLGLWPLPYVAEAPLYLVVVASLLLGVLIGAIAAWVRGSPRRRELRECRRQIAAVARELGVPSNRITEIIAGERAITAETAILLAERFGTSAEFWHNLQTAHDLEMARRRLEARRAGGIRPVTTNS